MRNPYALVLACGVFAAIVAAPPLFAEEGGKPTGSFDGIGVQLNPKRTPDGYFTIENVIPTASKAARGTLKKGDRILAVDGVAVRGKSLQEVIDRISGPAGTSVRLKVRRVGGGSPVEAAVTRKTFTVVTQ